MKLKKILAIANGTILVAVFAMLVMGVVHYITFLIVAGITALFAYRILPKMK